MEASTPYFKIAFWLVQNIRSIHNVALFITWGLTVIYVYPADDVRESFISGNDNHKPNNFVLFQLFKDFLECPKISHAKQLDGVYV